MIISAILLAMVSATLSGAQEADDSKFAPPNHERRPERRYVDGVYTATGQYGGQPSFITVRATLKDGVITAVTVIPHAHVPRSLELQRRFAAAVPKVMIGKPIDQVKVGKLAGSSGTPTEFNAAIKKIMEQASR